MSLHRAILTILYISALMFAGAVLVQAFGYYQLALEQRPHSSLHTTMKPGGSWGHGLGILGSAMMLLLFLYSARKRRFCGLRFGKTRHWLNIHIFFGIMGPVFVNLHTSFKIGGIVAVSYYSMMAVMLSGFIGRCLYVKIPRALSGDELTMREMQEKKRSLNQLLVEKYGLDVDFIAEIGTLPGLERGERLCGIAAIFALLKNDLTRVFQMRGVRRRLRCELSALPRQEAGKLLQIIKQQSLLVRKMTFLSTVQPLLHYWHVAHKPFAYVMIIIMFVHIAVVLMFGHQWVF